MEFAVIVCAALSLIAKRFSIPTIPLLLIAGIVLGRSGFGVIETDEISHLLSKLGIVFLLIYIGHEIKPKSIVEQGRNFAVVGFIDFVSNFFIIFAIASLWLDFYDSFIIASALYISSSAIVIQSLIENRRLIFAEAETILWMMIIEDIVLILLLLVLTAEISELASFALKIAALAAVVAVAARNSRMLSKLIRMGDEISALLVFSLAATAMLLNNFGIPETLAALMLGMIFSGIEELERYTRPFKDVFLVLFFFFFGASVELSYEAHVSVIAITLAAVLSKVIGGVAVGRILHGSTASGIEIGATTVARGEFSILIASLSEIEAVKLAVALTVIATSIIGAITAKYARRLRKFMNG